MFSRFGMIGLCGMALGSLQYKNYERNSNNNIPILNKLNKFIPYKIMAESNNDKEIDIYNDIDCVNLHNYMFQSLTLKPYTSELALAYPQYHVFEGATTVGNWADHVYDNQLMHIIFMGFIVTFVNIYAMYWY
mmetsp:Transcript_54170/g.66422  ORF Transcript_54170/g.66422 Transcript_54170/m.66422 type:complete len:133 (+) Transcript_54170:82-480(+)